MMITDSIVQSFSSVYGGKPLLVRSPGRINLIGEHTDYNEGFVLPATIDKAVIFAVRINKTNKIRLLAKDLQQNFEIPVNRLAPSTKKWPNYILGVVNELKNTGIEIPGFDCVYSSDIPIGAGLSSSAAIECGILAALDHLLGLNLSKPEMAKMAQQAEHNYAGVKCGIMDQFANLFGKKDHVIRLDCRSLHHEYFPLDMKENELILCDTRVKHSLASSAYNTRRMECETGVEILQRSYPAIQSLRDTGIEQIAAMKESFPGKVYDRCSYVVEENRRVIKACEELHNGHLDSLGKLMLETHEGLSQKYEVSCMELDHLVQTAMDTGVVSGARMMGGGFGGCTINLVKNNGVKTFIENIRIKYEKRFFQEPYIYQVKVSEGTSIIV